MDVGTFENKKQICFNIFFFLLTTMESDLILCMISLFLLKINSYYLVNVIVKYRNVFFILNIVSTHFILLLKNLDHF